MDDKTYRRIFCETRRQTYIRHNFPYANHLMTKAERKQHEVICHSARKKESDG
jgi:hypothetical protein